MGEEDFEMVYSVGEKGIIYETYFGREVIIDGCRPSLNLENEGCHELFLSWVAEKDFINAITFTYR